MKTLKRLCLFLMLATGLACAQGFRYVQFSAPGTDIGLKTQGTGISYHKLTWTGTGTIATCAVELDSSPDGVTWTAGGAIGSQACTSNGTSGIVVGTFNYVRIDVPTLTGGGTLSVVWNGYVTNPSSGLCIATTSTLSSSCGTTKAQLATVTNGASGTDCTTGGGTTAVTCIYSGSAWVYAGSSSSTGVTSITGDGALITNSGSTAAVTLTLGTATGHKYWGNNTGTTATAAFDTLAAADIPAALSSTTSVNGTTIPSSVTWPATKASTSHQWLNSFTQSTGAFTSTQPASTDLSDYGTVSPTGLFGTTLVDFSPAAQLKLPVVAAYASLANGEVGYDSTNKNWHLWQNGADVILAPLAAGFTSGHCGQPTSSAGVWQIADAGSACGTGSGAVSSVSNSDSTLTISPTTGAVVASLNLANANTWTATQTFGTHISIAGVTPSGATGTGNLVFATSPTLTTPNLGTPSAVTLTNGTGLPLAGVTFTSTANSVLGTTTAATTASLLGVPSCSGASNALTWTTGTGFGCNLISGSGGANVALSNLSAVAVNTALLPGTDNSFALDSASFRYTNLWLSALTQNASVGVGSSGELVNVGPPGTQGYFVQQWTNPTASSTASTATQVGDCTSPTTISGSTATATIQWSDSVGCTVEHDIAATAAATITLPTPTTLANAAAILNYTNNTASHTDTISPQTFQISQGSNAAGATLSVPPSTSCKINLDPVNASTWKADCHVNSTNLGVTSITASSPLTGGTITTTGSLGCTTCVTSSSSLTSTAIMTGAGSQGSQTPSGSATVDSSGDILAASINSAGLNPCSDTSGSGTVQSCSTTVSFTPTSQTSCITYTTTTANSGTGLTVNVNSLGAKSVAIPGSTTWTTTLSTSPHSVPSGKPIVMCYDGTNWNVVQNGVSIAGGGASITVNGGSALTSPVNFQNGNNTLANNPSGSNVEYDLYAASQTMFFQKWDTCGNADSSTTQYGVIWHNTLTGTATDAFNSALAWPNFCERIWTSTATNPSGVLISGGDTPTPGSWLLPPLNSNSGWEAQFRFNLSTTTTQKMYVGLGHSFTAAAPGNNWFGVRYDTSASDTTFVFEAATASASTLAYTGVSTGYHTLRIWSPTSGQINMSIDGGNAYCFTTSAVSPGCAGGNSTSANITTSALDPFILWENLSTTTGVTFTTTGAYFQATGLSR